MFHRGLIAVVFLQFLSTSLVGQDNPPASEQATAAPTSYEEATDRTKQTAGFRNLQKIGLAFHGYHDIFGRFPPAISYGPDGKTPYSWRVELLPALKHYANQVDPETDVSTRAAYDAAIASCGYDTSQSWDSPGNRKMLESIPDDYRHPADEIGSTDAGFYAIIGRGTVFDPRTVSRYTDIKAWPASTLMVAEYRAREPWTKPVDVEYSATGTVPRLGGFSSYGFMTVSADGAVHFVHEIVGPIDLRAFITSDQSDTFQIPGIPHRYK